MKLTKNWFSPAVLFLITWVLAHVAAYLGPKEEIYSINGFQTTFTLEGSIWFLLATSIFLMGVQVANKKEIYIELPLLESVSSEQSRKISHLTIIVFYFIGSALLFILLYWTTLAVREVGSISRFVQLTHEQWHIIRRVWPDQRPFVGGRLAYTALISVVIFATAGLVQLNSQTYSSQSEKRRHYITLRGLLIIGLVPLMALPLVVSQRLLLGTALIGSLTIFAVGGNSGLSIKYPLGGITAGFGVWTLQESVRIGLSTGGLIESFNYGTSRILFYFSNNVGNMHRGVAFISERSYGFESFQFIFEYLFISDFVRNNYMQAYYSAAEPYRGGGTFTGLGIPYLDFGIFGLIIIFIWGYTSQYLFLKASDNILALQLYGLFAASIVLSWHAAIWRGPSFWLNIGILIIVPLTTALYKRHLGVTKYDASQVNS